MKDFFVSTIIYFFCFGILNVSARLDRRTFAVVQSDLTKDDSDINALTSAINKYDGSFNAAVAVQNAASTLDNDLKTTCNDFKSTGTLTTAQATTIVNYLTNTVEPDLKKCVSAAQAKAPSFMSSGVTSGVCSALQTLQADFQCVCGAAKTDSPAASQSGLASVCTKIDNDFKAAETTLKCS